MRTYTTGYGGMVLKKLFLVLGALLVLFSFFVWRLPPPVVEPSTSKDNTTPSIETIVRTIKDQKFETLAAFDADGNLLFETTDLDALGVTMTAEQANQFREQGGALVIHNHPSGTSFSGQDLYAEAKRGSTRAIVVTWNKIYILTPSWRGWGDPDALKAAHEQHLEHYAQLVETDDSIITTGQTCWVYDQAVAAVAEEFGLEYQQIAMKDLFCFHGIQVVTAG